MQGACDSTLYPSNISKNAEFKIYRRAFCRLLPVYFSEEGKMSGLDAYWFELSENAFYDHPDDPITHCFCGTESKCLKKGLGNISPCYSGELKPIFLMTPFNHRTPNFLFCQEEKYENLKFSEFQSFSC